MLNNKKRLFIRHNVNQIIQILEQKKFLNHKTYNVKDLLSNLNLSPNARSYSDESKLFYLCLFKKSAEAYHWLEKAFPIPYETNLRKTFTNLIKETEIDLLSLDNLPKIISKLNIKETVDAVLSVDAFSSTYLMKMTDAQKESKDQNDEIVFSYDNDSNLNVNNFNDNTECVNN